MTRELTEVELCAASDICYERNEKDSRHECPSRDGFNSDGCPTCRADVVRLVEGGPPASGEDEPTTEEALANYERGFAAFREGLGGSLSICGGDARDNAEAKAEPGLRCPLCNEPAEGHDALYLRLRNSSNVMCALTEADIPEWAAPASAEPWPEVREEDVEWMRIIRNDASANGFVELLPTYDRILAVLESVQARGGAK